MKSILTIIGVLATCLTAQANSLKEPNITQCRVDSADHTTTIHEKGSGLEVVVKSSNSRGAITVWPLQMTAESTMEYYAVTSRVTHVTTVENLSLEIAMKNPEIKRALLSDMVDPSSKTAAEDLETFASQLKCR
ncbi:MAG: hypothetical protein IPJ84_07560 [Bdellovibrionales bacterium]|nr:hypothetical protein [Bdellovibrionales bacterium]